MERSSEKIRSWLGKLLKPANMTDYLRSIDEWMRRRIRMVFWKKRKRARTGRKNLLSLGVSNSNAGVLAYSKKVLLADREQPNHENSPLKSETDSRGLDSSFSVLTTTGLR